MPDDHQATPLRSAAHPDNQRVCVEMWVIDVLEGDVQTALLFSQLLWWHQPSPDGRPRVRYVRDGKNWLVRADDDWHHDCRMTTKQVRRAKSVLLDRGLIEHRRFKKDGAPTSAWRPIPEAVQAARDAICPDPEIPLQGQIQGIDPPGANGIDPHGANPSSLSGSKDPNLRGPLTPVAAIFDAWRTAAGKSDRTVLDPKRRRLITGALGAYPVDDLVDAVRGWRHSPHHAGQNDTGTVYNDLGLLLRDAEHIERFRDLERRGAQAVVPVRGTNRSLANGARWKAGREAREAAR